MRTGQLDRVVRLERVTRTRTDTGGWDDTWSTVAQEYASRRDTLGSERLTTGVEQNTTDSVFRIRWREGITGQMRVVHETEVWDIMAVGEVGRRQFLDLTCRRVVL